jgi:hypothetical protein
MQNYWHFLSSIDSSTCDYLQSHSHCVARLQSVLYNNYYSSVGQYSGMVDFHVLMADLLETLTGFL